MHRAISLLLVVWLSGMMAISTISVYPINGCTGKTKTGSFGSVKAVLSFPRFAGTQVRIFAHQNSMAMEFLAGVGIER